MSMSETFVRRATVLKNSKFDTVANTNLKKLEESGDIKVIQLLICVLGKVRLEIFLSIDRCDCDLFSK